MKISSKGKVRRSQEEWQEIFARFRESGMTEAAFCREEKIAKSSFSKRKVASRVQRRKPGFVEFTSPSPTGEASASECELVLTLPSGARPVGRRSACGSAKRRIFAYSEPTDMRKSFHRLLALVQRVFKKQDPYSGDLFVFVNRRGNYIKILAWDRTGFTLYAKKLERGRFLFPRKDITREVSEKSLRFILDGIALGGRRSV